MSTAPNGWQNPKTNWASANVPLPTDFNRIESNLQAIELGQRTLDPTQAPNGNAGTLRQMLDWFANRIRAITGMTNWYDTPPYTLAGATPSATANRLVARDANGRAQFADPLAAQDAATKGYVDASLQSHISGGSAVVAVNVAPTTIDAGWLGGPIYQTKQIDRLNEYNPATGEFIATQSGWYLATATLSIEIAPGSYTTVWLSSDASIFAEVEMPNPSASKRRAVVNLAGITPLNAGEAVWVAVINDSYDTSIVVGASGDRLAIFRIA